MPAALPPIATPCPSGAAARARVIATGRAAVVLCLVLAAAACGKKGPPLAPRQRIPAKVADWTVGRVDETVFLTLGVPTANIAGDTPGDVAQVEVYAVTAATPPVLANDRVASGLTLIASAPVRRPVPPPPPQKDGTPLPPMPVVPGLDQGAKVTFSEPLTAAILAAPDVAAIAAAAAPDVVTLDPSVALSVPAVYAPTTMRRRHYVAVAVSRGGRRGPWSDWRSVPLTAPSGAPGAPVITFDDTGIAASWTPAPDAAIAPPPPADGLLESRPFGPVTAPTRYNVYDAAAVATGGAVTRPAPLNPKPLTTPGFAAPGIAFGTERCLVVRGIDTIGGVDIEGPASPRACVTPLDTFPPPAPAALEAVGGSGVISLIWEAVEASDLAGYLVFRGQAPGEPTTLLTPSPVSATSFEDRTVTAGVRYVYVVVAVDSATPPNRSAPSNRAEEAARQ